MSNISPAPANANLPYTADEVKKSICEMIDLIFGKNTIPNNRPDRINPAVIQLLDKVIVEIQKCSKSLLQVEITYSFLYAPPNLLVLNEFLFGVGFSIAAVAFADWWYTRNPIDTYISWVKVLLNQKQYRTCVVSVATRYKSQMAMALMGMDY